MARTTSVHAAVAYYHEHGCSAEQLAIGMLKEQANDEEEAHALVDAALKLGASEIDLWSDMWGAGPDAQTATWAEPLARFLAPDQPLYANTRLSRGRHRGIGRGGAR